MATKKLDPVHPGEILQKEFSEPMDLSQNRLALALGVPVILAWFTNGLRIGCGRGHA